MVLPCPMGTDPLSCLDELLGSCPTNPLQCFSNIIGNGFTMIFGNAIFLGLFLMVVLMAIGIALRLEGDAFILYFAATTIITATAFFSVTWIAGLFMAGAGVIFFLALVKIIRNR